MPNISLSALLDWNLCQRKYMFSRQERLSLRVRPAPPGSGEAVHAAIEHWIRTGNARPPNELERGRLVTEALNAAFHGDANRYGKFVKGACNALSLVPDWVWAGPWQIEYKVSYTLGDWTVNGRVDLWADTPEGIVLVDWKVSASEPLDHMLWSPQIRYYALMLQNEFPDRAIHYRYILLPTQGTAAEMRLDWPFTRRVADIAKADFDQLITDYVAWHDAKVYAEWHGEQVLVRPAYTRSACGYCDYKPICQEILTGGDPEAVKAQLYLTRGVR